MDSKQIDKLNVANSNRSIEIVRRSFVLFIFLPLFFGTLRAQKPAVVHLPELKAWMESDNDTIYVLNFWATWCKPCVAEMPYFDRLQKEYEGQKLKVIFLSLDFVEDYDARLLPFLEKTKPYSEVVLLDEPKYNKWIDLVAEEWSGAIPATLFVKHKSGIRHFHEGDFTFESLKAQVETLMQ